MIGRSRNDSSTIRATPSASGEPSNNRNFSNNSPARSGDSERPPTTDGGATVVASMSGVSPGRSWADIGVISRRASSGTPRAREILRKVPAWGLLVLPRSI